MTQGERYVWAAAFVNRLSDVNDPYFQMLLSRRGERKQKQAIRQLSSAAADFADVAVNAMSRARKDLSRQKKRDTPMYKRLLEMLKGRF